MMNNDITCDMTNKPIRVQPSIIDRVNAGIGKIVSPNPMDSIPLMDIFGVLTWNGLTPVDEDGTRWSGFLCGRDGRATIELSYDHRPVKNHCLQLSWHKFDTGRYEVIAYVG